MTVLYTHLLGNTHPWTVFFLLCKWKGSVFKLVGPQLLVFLILYAIISLLYRFLIQEYAISKIMFQYFVYTCQELLTSLPVAFVLGFYVSNVVTWWQKQFDSLPWPDDIALQIAAFMQETKTIDTEMQSRVATPAPAKALADKKSSPMALGAISMVVSKSVAAAGAVTAAAGSAAGKVAGTAAEIVVKKGVSSKPKLTPLAPVLSKTADDADSTPVVLMRRTIVRYINLGMILAIRGISNSAQTKFPDLRSILEAGLMNENELQILESIDDMYNRYYVPIVWASNLIRISRRKQYLTDDRQLDVLIESLAKFRQHLGDLFTHQWINPPLVYTQVATITVYAYFFVAIMAWQFVQGFDYYFPFFGMLQFVFYMGWLKVAENLLNPFGEKDEDFDIGYLIERNIQMAYLIVDDMHRKHPEIKADQFWSRDVNMDPSNAVFQREVKPRNVDKDSEGSIDD